MSDWHNNNKSTARDRRMQKEFVKMLREREKSTEYKDANECFKEMKLELNALYGEGSCLKEKK